MTTYERLEELKVTELELTGAHDTYNRVEAELVTLIGEYVMGAEVSCTAYGPGHIVAYKGTTLDNIIVDVEFADMTKRFSLAHIITVARFIKFEDIFEIGSIYDEAMAIHIELTTQLRAIDTAIRQQENEAKKKAAEEKKLAEKYEKQKAKAIKDFETMTTQEKEIITQADEFYYSLGWLAKHVGVITAKLPDYLGSAFEKHFGVETPKTLVDGRAKTIGGYAKQWSWEFVASVKKLKDTTAPAYLQAVTTDISKGIHNTSFVWNLVDNYGFQFGKTQDVEKIRNHVPASCLASFEAGLA